jgi:hypothetical protein
VEEIIDSYQNPGIEKGWPAWAKQRNEFAGLLAELSKRVDEIDGYPANALWVAFNREELARKMNDEEHGKIYTIEEISEYFLDLSIGMQVENTVTPDRNIGRPIVDTAKNFLVLDCLDLYLKRGPDKPRQTTGGFPHLVASVYRTVGGKRNDSLDEPIRSAFEARGLKSPRKRSRKKTPQK